MKLSILDYPRVNKKESTKRVTHNHTRHGTFIFPFSNALHL